MREVQAEFSVWSSRAFRWFLGGTISSSSHLFHRQRVRLGSVTFCGCSSMTAPQKGAPERRGLEERISSTRCVSSMLICHPLNLYCSSTGSISHIARTLAGTSNRSRRRRTQDLAAEAAGEQRCNLRPPGAGAPGIHHPSVSAPLQYLHLQR